MIDIDLKVVNCFFIIKATGLFGNYLILDATYILIKPLIVL